MSNENTTNSSLIADVQRICEVLTDVAKSSDDDLTGALEDMAAKLQNCLNRGSHESLYSLKKIIFDETPYMFALINDDGILDTLDRKYNDQSTVILNLKGMIALLLWKILS